MEPTSRYPFNVRSFFTNRETKDLGHGIVLWRGYFQSVRPAPGKMLVNIDISTGMMYKSGPLIHICLEFLGKPANDNNANLLAPTKGFPERERQRLQRFLTGIKVVTTLTGGSARTPRALKKLTSSGAKQLSFKLREGGTITVADYFQRTYNRSLRWADVICAEV